MSKHKTKAEQQWLNRVAELGCIICKRPAEIHHIGNGTMSKRASNFEVIPLCCEHHRTGGRGVAVHRGRRSWEAKHGTERELLQKVQAQLHDEAITDWMRLIEGDEF